MNPHKIYKFWIRYLNKFGRASPYPNTYRYRRCTLSIESLTMQNNPTVGSIYLRICCSTDKYKMSRYPGALVELKDIPSRCPDVIAILEAIKNPSLMPTCVSIPWAYKIVEAFLKSKPV